MYTHEKMLRSSTIGLLMSCLVFAGCEEVTKIVQVPAAAPPPVQNPPPPPPPPPPEEPEPPEDIGASLGRLGVRMEDSPRISNEGVELPESYAPFGKTLYATVDDEGNAHLGNPLELALVGFSLDAQDAFLTVIDNVPFAQRNVSHIPLQPVVLHKRNDTQAPWASEFRGAEGAPPVTFRAAAAGDVDGDGVEEFAVVRVQGAQVMLEIQDVDDPNAPVFVGIVQVPASVGVVNDVRIASGDFDGDRREELAVALSGPPVPGARTRTSVLVLDDRGNDFAQLREIVFESSLNGVTVHPVLEAGNLDYDVHDELVVVINEMAGSNQPSNAVTRLFAFDDSSGNYAQLLADTPSVVTPSGTHVAQTTDVAIGDFDDDDINEIIAAGMSGLLDGNPRCNVGGNLRYVAVMYEFDGRTIGKTRMAASRATDQIYPLSTLCPEGDWLLRFAYVSAVDLDGDRDHEFHVNQYVFASFPAQEASWDASASAVLDSSALFPEFAEAVFDRSTGVLQAGDVNGDGREDIVSFRAGVPDLSVYSHTDLDGFYRTRMPIEDEGVYETQIGAINPQLLVFSGDIKSEGEVVVLQYVGHFLDFTEPLVLAALAAPPCVEDIRQNLEACATSWGQSETTTLDGEREIKFTAGVSVGAEIENPPFSPLTKEFAIKLNIEHESGFIKSEAYEVSKTVTFETGPQEDSVVFTSIPYDVYRYEQVARTSDDGSKVIYEIRLPREAAVRIATVDFYNAHTTDSALKIDESVFQHRAGDVESYPNLRERDEILDNRTTQVQALRSECPFCWKVDPESVIDNPFRSFDPFAALPGLTSKVVGVGQGSGATEVAVELNVSNGTGRSLETSAEIEIEFVRRSGFAFGFQIGGGLARSTKTTHTNGTSYVGTIGSIHADDFIENQYRFGLFTYLQADPDSGLEFEVINYWVED